MLFFVSFPCCCWTIWTCLWQKQVVLVALHVAHTPHLVTLFSSWALPEYWSDFKNSCLHYSLWHKNMGLGCKILKLSFKMFLSLLMFCNQIWMCRHEWVEKESVNCSCGNVIPCPRRPPDRASMAVPKPSSRHTTVADSRFQLSSHMVPHSPFFNTSTRPSPTMAPPRRRTSGCWKEITETLLKAYSKCTNWNTFSLFWSTRVRIWNFHFSFFLWWESWVSRLGGFMFIEHAINAALPLTV